MRATSVLALGLLAAVLALVCLPQSANATHFAYGTISWKQSFTPARPTKYDVSFLIAVRRSYPVWQPLNAAAGTSFTGDVGLLEVFQQRVGGVCCPGGKAKPWSVGTQRC